MADFTITAGRNVTGGARLVVDSDAGQDLTGVELTFVVKRRSADPTYGPVFARSTPTEVELVDQEAHPGRVLVSIAGVDTDDLLGVFLWRLIAGNLGGDILAGGALTVQAAEEESDAGAHPIVIAATDPGAVGAGVIWVELRFANESGGDAYARMLFRNSDDTGWDPLSPTTWSDETTTLVTSPADVSELYLPDAEDAYLQAPGGHGLDLIASGKRVRVDALGVHVGNETAPVLLSGSVDPSAGAGVPAVPGSLYLRDLGDGAGELWVKFAAADDDWRSGGVDLSDALPTEPGAGGVPGDGAAAARDDHQHQGPMVTDGFVGNAAATIQFDGTGADGNAAVTVEVTDGVAVVTVGPPTLAAILARDPHFAPGIQMHGPGGPTANQEANLGLNAAAGDGSGGGAQMTGGTGEVGFPGGYATVFAGSSGSTPGAGFEAGGGTPDEPGYASVFTDGTYGEIGMVLRRVEGQGLTYVQLTLADILAGGSDPGGNAIWGAAGAAGQSGGDVWLEGGLGGDGAMAAALTVEGGRAGSDVGFVRIRTGGLSGSEAQFLRGTSDGRTVWGDAPTLAEVLAAGADPDGVAIATPVVDGASGTTLDLLSAPGGGDGGHAFLAAGNAAAGGTGGSAQLLGGTGDAGSTQGGAVVADPGTASDHGRVKIKTGGTFGTVGEFLRVTGLGETTWGPYDAVDPGNIAVPGSATAPDVATKLNALLEAMRAVGMIA